MECGNARMATAIYNSHFMFANGKGNIFFSEHYYLDLYL